MPDVVGAHNHTIDALRCALQPMIRTGNSGRLRFVAQELEAIEPSPCDACRMRVRCGRERLACDAFALFL